MRNQFDIDAAVSHAIVREIGERLRAYFSEHELPASLRAQLDRLDQSGDHSLQPIVPELKREWD
jgi:hypothetical protein